jgi:RND family efflux transporter MFP subunit
MTPERLRQIEQLYHEAREHEPSERAAFLAQVNYQRLKNIHDRDADVLPVQDVDQARSGLGVANGKLHNAQAQIRVAEAAVSAAQAEIDTLNTLIAYTRIEAPLSGVVTERFVDRGAMIQAAAASRTQAAPVVTIARIDRVRALVDVPEPSAPYIRTGTVARVQVESLPGQSFPARVARIAGVLDPSSRTLHAEIDIPNAGERSRPGMTVKVSLELRKFLRAVTVPVAAVQTQGSEHSVVLVQEGKAKRVKVKTGLESPEWIQIVEGLKSGEEVVVASAAPLDDGSPVSVRP